jgi:uncharacterized protein YbcI
VPRKPVIPGEGLAAIANASVQLKTEFFGRGPSAAKAYLCDDVLVCVMRGGLTPVERTLLDAGDDRLVREVRLRWQELMKEPFCEAVQRLSGYEVLACESQVLFDPDTIVQLAVLGASDADLDQTVG